jgi:hypothetical protein
LQAELGGVDFPPADQFAKHKVQFQTDKALAFQHVNRLIRCIIDCYIHRGDSVAVRDALELARSFGARVWDNSPLQIKQIGGLGIVAVRKLASADITCLETLEMTEASRIDTIMSRHPPFGKCLLAKLKDFPKPRVSVKMMGKETKPGKPVKINFRVEIGFLNDTPPAYYNRNALYVCFLAETSDGRLIEFRRMLAKGLQNGHAMMLSAELHHQDQYIACHVSCDEIAGTSKYAELKPDLPASLFPASRQVVTSGGSKANDGRVDPTRTMNQISSDLDEFGDGEIDDYDLLAAAQEAEFTSIEVLEKQMRSKTGQKWRIAGSKDQHETQAQPKEPVQLDNGKWLCNHSCKDKTACRHLCCREGLDKPPKVGKATTVDKPNDKKITSKDGMKKTKSPFESGQTTLSLGSRLPGMKAKRDNSIEMLDLTGNYRKNSHQQYANKDQERLNCLHEKTLSSTASFKPMNKKIPSHHAKGKKQRITFISDSDSDPTGFDPAPSAKKGSSDYGEGWFDTSGLPSTTALFGGVISTPKASTKRSNSSQLYDEDASNLEAGMLGLEDSLGLASNAKNQITFAPASSKPQETTPKAKAKTDFSGSVSANSTTDLSSGTLIRDKQSSIGPRLFVIPRSNESSNARPMSLDSTRAKRSQHAVDEDENLVMQANKRKRENSRPLSAGENVANMGSVVTGAKTNRDEVVKDKEEKKDEVVMGKAGDEKGHDNAKVEKWWETDEIDQELLKELGPYVNFI